MTADSIFTGVLDFLLEVFAWLLMLFVVGIPILGRRTSLVHAVRSSGVTGTPFVITLRAHEIRISHRVVDAAADSEALLGGSIRQTPKNLEGLRSAPRALNSSSI